MVLFPMKSAQQLAEDNNVLLWDRNKLIEMINNVSDDKLKLLINITK